MKRGPGSGETQPAETPRRPYAPRRTFFELPPLELECMKVLWEQEDASVREIREQLAASHRPLAYTTVETIMDRLNHKGVVERRKVGKAHRYTPVYQKTEARAAAVAALAEHFFDGSRQSLLAHLQGAPVNEPRRSLRSLAAAAPSRRPPLPARTRPAVAERGRRTARDAKRERAIDTTLL